MFMYYTNIEYDEEEFEMRMDLHDALFVVINFHQFMMLYVYIDKT